MYVSSLILEQLSDIRDPLEANETEDIRQRRTDLELKYQTIGERQQEISQKINLCVIAQDYAAGIQHIQNIISKQRIVSEVILCL